MCASAHRPGSLDADIDRATVVVNDFQGFFAAHPRITRIFFNGATAAALYRRLVLPRLSDPHRHLETLTLPSTSPAHARLSYEAKLDAYLTNPQAAMPGSVMAYRQANPATRAAIIGYLKEQN